MNLKERQNKEKKKPENSSSTMQTSKQQSAEQILLSKVLELSDALNEEKQRTRSQAQMISELTSQRSILTSKTQEQQLIIAALRTEISEAQNINKSLQKNNQSLIRQNDDLRFDHGVESLKEVDDLRDEICSLHLKIAELNKQVDHSTAAAVNKAYRELEENDQKAKKTMKDFQAFVKLKVKEYVDEIENRNSIIESLYSRIRSEKSRLWLYRDLLFVHFLCTLAAGPVILQDIWELLTTAALFLEEYYEWIICPRYSPYPGAVPELYEPGITWAFRIASIIAGLALAAFLAYASRRLYNKVRAQWCRLASRITVTLMIIVSVAGPYIKEYLQWNTAVLLFILFLLEMKLLLRFESMFAKKHKTDDWEFIKEQKNKSFFVTYHIYTGFREMIRSLKVNKEAQQEQFFSLNAEAETLKAERDAGIKESHSSHKSWFGFNKKE